MKKETRFLAPLLGLLVVGLSLAGCGGGGSLTGTVNDGAGTIVGQAVDEQGQPVRGATVALSQAGRQAGVVTTTTTDIDGEFIFESISPGTFTLNIVANGHLTVLVTVDVAPGATVRVTVRLRTSSSVEVDNTGSISGHVLDSVTGEGLVGVEVKAERRSPGRPLKARTVSTTGGEFRLEGLFPGMWDLQADAEGFKSSRTSVEVHANAESQVDLRMAPED
jgi:protocatechuate 3,4-dioxygenase beta subunit